MPVAKESDALVLTLDSREVAVTHPDKPYFTRGVRLSKLDIVRYFLAVAPGALAGIRDRPIVLKRFVDGAEGEPFYQKRAPAGRPDWLRAVTLSFPSGRTAEEVVVDDPAGLAWVVNLGCIELHPHPVRSGDLDHPDELRIDLDPTPGIEWVAIRRVAVEVKALLEELGLTGWPKTSGSRGMHVNVRIHPRWTFTEVRRAALALSREMERRMPGVATSKWWKEERRGVFLDYNQNAKDRTTCSAYSVRPLPDARVSAPLSWEEVPDCEPADFTVLTMPGRFAAIGDPHRGMDAAKGSLEALLELAARDEAAGLGDAPWPPQYRKMEGEPKRVAPSRAKRPGKTLRKRMPLIVIAKSPDRAAALAGLERWKARHPQAASHLAVDDVLVDNMRGRSSTWTRIRVNLRNVPEALLPPEAPPDPDDDPTRPFRESKRQPSRS
jgi:bifunctional non-homologous end joining protein LigD